LLIEFKSKLPVVLGPGHHPVEEFVRLRGGATFFL
jgi:hypothetical protein